jgi:type I restriction enzyme, R subunit
MARNERLTCKELIEPRLAALGWAWQEQLRIGPGRVNLTGDAMYDETQSIIADYLLRYRGVPTFAAVLDCLQWQRLDPDGQRHR